MKSPQASKLLLALALTAASSLPLSAQTLYRCGKTFSQTPCGTDAEATKLRQGGGSDATATTADAPHGAKACMEAARTKLRVLPRHTLELEHARPGKAEAIVYADQPLVARTLTLELVLMNGRTFVASHAAHCHLSEDGQRVLRLGM